MWFIGTISAALADCATTPALDLARDEVSAMRIQLDGDLTVLPSADDRIRLAACDGAPKLARDGGAWTLTSREPVDATLWLPAGLDVLTIHGHDGALSVRVPAVVAVVSGSGPVEVGGANSLRVAYHVGDVRADELRGALTVDHVDGALRATQVTGEARVDGVTGAVEVDAPALWVDGVAR